MTPENYDPNTNESGDSYQSSHPYGVPEGQRPGPYQHYQQQPPVQPPRRTGSQALAAASMVMAICSFLFMLNMGSLFFGSLGVIFALLSRGAGRMSGLKGLYHRHHCRYLHVCFFPAFQHGQRRQHQPARAVLQSVHAGIPDDTG